MAENQKKYTSTAPKPQNKAFAVQAETPGQSHSGKSANRRLKFH
jgi:hypothetical protein